MSQAKQQYFIELTDTFSGEANYSWVTRFLVSASSMLGAIRKVTHETGFYARCVMDSGDVRRYDCTHAAVCYFAQEADGNESEHYSNIKHI